MRGLAKVITGMCAAAVIAGGALAGCGTSHRAVTPPRVSCGSAVTHSLNGSTELFSASPGALPCFAAAVMNCHSASISVTAMGVDAGIHDVFVIKPGTEPCQVAEQSQFYMVSGGVRHGPVTTTRCRIAAATAEDVTLSCSGRDILIPATVSHSEAAS